MIILILFLFLGSVIAFTVYFKEIKEMKVVHQEEILFLENRILEEHNKFSKIAQNYKTENQIQLKLTILKKQVALLTFISNQTNES